MVSPNEYSIVELKKPPQPTPLLIRIQNALTHEIALLADLVGVFGIPQLILELFKYLNKDTWWGIKKDIWAWGIGFSPFMLLVVVAILVWIRDVRLQALLLDQLLEKTKDTNVEDTQRLLKEHTAAIEAARQDKSREAHKQACNAMSHVFGFRLLLRRYTYTVHHDGSATCNDIIQFECNRRSLGRWSRTVISDTIQEFPGSQKVKLTDPFEFRKTQDSSLGFDGRRILNEHFTFVPTIHRVHGMVQLSYEENVPAGSFLQTDPSGKKEFDFASAFVQEPTDRLEIVIDLRDFEVGQLDADAVYGPAEQPLLRETVEAKESLREDKPDGRRTATLAIDYPVLGVAYRLTWSLAKRDVPSVSGLSLK